MLPVDEKKVVSARKALRPGDTVYYVSGKRGYLYEAIVESVWWRPDRTPEEDFALWMTVVFYDFHGTRHRVTQPHRRRYLYGARVHFRWELPEEIHPTRPTSIKKRADQPKI